MTYQSEGAEPATPRRWEYEASNNEPLSAILERIRQTPASELLLNITRHEQLRTDGSLRRTIAAVAAEIGKRVTFSVVEQKGAAGSVQKTEMPVRGETPPRSASSEPSLTSSSQKQRVQRKERVPVAVLSPPSAVRRAPSLAVLTLPRLSRSGRLIAFSFAFFAGLLTTAAVVFLVPHATVAIIPVVEPINADLTIRASTRVTNPDIGAGQLPARISTVEEAVEGSFPVEHVVEKGKRAAGNVQVVNKTSSEQRIKGGSRLQADNGVVFRTEQAAFVPPNGAVDVSVTAGVGGTKGNLTEGTLAFVALPAGARQVIFARVTSPLSGGTDDPVKTLAEEDVRRANDAFVREHEARFREIVQRQRPDETLDRTELVRVRVANSKPREPLGQEIDTFHLQGMLRGEFFAIREQDLLALARSMVLSRAGEGKTLGRDLSADTVRVGGVDWEEGRADLAVHLDNVVRTDFDEALLKERLAGRTPDGAAEYIRALSGVKDVHVELRPFWIRRIPSIPRNILLEMRLPES